MRGDIIHAPVRGFLPERVRPNCVHTIEPGIVFDVALSVEGVVEGHRTIDERVSAKILLQPQTIEIFGSDAHHYRLGTPR